MRPLFLQALDHVDDPADGTYVAECSSCRDLLLVEPVDGWWHFNCDGGCTHEEIVRWLAIDDLRVTSAQGDRMWICMMLATTPDVWAGLLLGEPVNEDALDPECLQRFRKAGIVE